ncbi:MAG: SDR family oxidoreductase [Meiothermus sp.]|nr:SDR family oxidoreductase [Meiothermus sp.]
MAESLRGKVALVTGASSGIGEATARALAAEGVRLALVARSKEKLEALAAELGDALAVAADVAEPGQLEAAVRRSLEHFGRIDVLLPNAGLYIPGDVWEGNPDEWDYLLRVNVNAVFRLVNLVLPHMMARGSGDILVTSSISGHQAIQWEPVYSASKHAIQSFVHGVRRQVRGHGIRVGAIAPGIVLNNIWKVHDEEAIGRQVAAKAGIRSEDVAEAVVWMLSRPPHVTIRDLVILPQGQDI